MKMEDKDKLAYLNEDQKVYLRLVRKSLPMHDFDMQRTLVYLAKHGDVIKPFEREATNNLSGFQKNQVLCELLLPY
ncbi:hypothetical protein [Lapidilactobacillus wuchangensis]|uniref:hypothetical protein n=1 Tax=Lapidilactobacillus wuchangensis TaxID=2486001 RepID=UPI000F79D806|nr:hypothetical protein [Lapidilactobacillus wuchangensis]